MSSASTPLGSSVGLRLPDKASRLAGPEPQLLELGRSILNEGVAVLERARSCLYGIIHFYIFHYISMILLVSFERSRVER